MSRVLTVANLRVSYGSTPAVRDVSFAMDAGEILAVVGESGSGKSTLALALMGLLDGTTRSGSASLDVEGRAVDLLAASEGEMCSIRGRKISMIFQEPMSSLNPIMRVEAQIAEAIRLHQHMTAGDLRQRSLELLSDTGIADPERCLRSYPHQLSGGQCQRVGIAMALAHRPAILVADEPTTALDVTVQAQIVNCLESLRRASGIAILFITHDLGLVRRFADRILVMYAGEIVESGTVAEVFTRPRMPYTAALLASRPRFDEDKEPIPLEPIPGHSVGAASAAPGCSFHPRCHHALPETCVHRKPELQTISPGHVVRCLRWEQVT